MSTTSKASQRIASLLDENSFVEIGALVTARAMSTARMLPYWGDLLVKCMQRRLQTSTTLL